MSAVIIVVDTPFFAVTDEAGRFRIDDLPPGDYTMTIWHERLGAQSRTLAAHANGTAGVEVIFRGAELR